MPPSANGPALLMKLASSDTRSRMRCALCQAFTPAAAWRM
jgi:hypothetical protein